MPPGFGPVGGEAVGDGTVVLAGGLESLPPQPEAASAAAPASAEEEARNRRRERFTGRRGTRRIFEVTAERVNQAPVSGC